MPRLLLINPNSSASMTQAMLETARRVSPGTDITAWTSPDGPAVIEGPEHGAMAVPPLLSLVALAEGFDCIIIGCFDDTGLEEANEIATCPVIGIGQAAFHMAALRWERFSVVTTLPVSVPVIDDNIRRYGLDGKLGRVRASNLGVAETEDRSGHAARKILDEARQAIAEDGCDAIILGCAGMSQLTADVRSALPVPVHDGVEAALRLALAIADQTPAA